MYCKANKLFFSTLLFIFSASFVFAGNQSRIDSLLNLINTKEQDTNYVNRLNELGYAFLNQGMYDKSLLYGKQALSAAKKLNYYSGHFASLDLIGSSYRNRGEYEKAIAYYFELLKLHEQKNNKMWLFPTLGTIGTLYSEQKNFTMALHYFKQSLQLAREIKDEYGIQNAFNCIGAAYYHQEMYDSAMAYYMPALELRKKLGDEMGIANSLTNIGLIHMRKQEYEKALENHLGSLKIYEEKKSAAGIANSLNNIGDIYYFLKKYERAEENYLQSLAIAKETHEMERLLDNYADLARNYSAKKQFGKAHKYAMLDKELSSVIFSKESAKQMAEMQAKYENEKKEQQIQLLNKDKYLTEMQVKKQQIVIYSIIIGLALVLLLAFFIYRSYRQKEIANKKLHLKNILIEQQRTKILDSINYSRYIQESVIPTEEEVNKILPFPSFIFFLPKDIVSGDFYWFSSVKENGHEVYVIAAADCTGHGVPGAFLSLIGNMLLNEAVNENRITSPAAILKKMYVGINNTLHPNKGGTHDGMDIAVCTIDPLNKNILFAGAIHPLYIVRNTRVVSVNGFLPKEELIRGDSVTIGENVYRKNNSAAVIFAEHRIAISSPMMIYLFSDGYADQFRKTKRERFGSSRFKKLLLESAYHDLPKQKEILHETLLEWKEQQPQMDDILVWGIRL